YDTAASGSPITSGHFRGRVTTHKVWQKWTGTEEPDYVVYYDYDLMGRVKREIHEIPLLKRFKHDKIEMMYLYDAISGKVREMRYNVGKKDQFFHKFAYDAMGNLKYVWTSRDGKKWTLESALKYYPDGKLMRREIRPKDLMLQGLDYAYTLDGWLKAINSEVLKNDPSRDGISGQYEYFARDVFSLLLRYYPNDYSPIKPTATPLEAGIVSGNSHLYKPYYTGWISSWSLNLDTQHTAYSFRYDRLGRLTQANTLTGFDGTEWNATLIKNYSTKYSYDLVGNILNLTRYDGSGRLIDELEYNYYNLASNNRLEYIADKVGQIIGIDLDNQSPENYRYDPVGNMIFDKSRSLKVSYTYSNKPKRIKLGGQTIRMLYNPSGYRFFKGSGSNKGDVFIYNSQGQLLAKYSIEGNRLKLDFMPIYEGTKRLGLHEPEGVKWEYCPPGLACGAVFDPCLGQLGVSVGPCGRGVVLKASKKYELTDHLGNVRVVIRDQRVPVSQNGSTVAYYKPLVHEISDYYPYGWQKILGRYKFGANAGSLFEDWDSTKGTYYTLYRLLDARIGRWYHVEILIDEYPWQSGYVYVFGHVVTNVDVRGDDTLFIDENAKKDFEKTYEAISQEVKRLQTEIDKLLDEWRINNGRWTAEEIQQWSLRVKGVNERLSKVLEMKNVLDEIIKNPNIVFAYASIPYKLVKDNKGKPVSLAFPGGDTKVLYRSKDITVVLISYTRGILPSLMHESRHGAGLIWGEWSSVDQHSNDYYDEYIAYEFEREFYSIFPDISFPQDAISVIGSISPDNYYRDFYNVNDVKQLIKIVYENKDINKVFEQHCTTMKP
ncbi:MAG: hypothetical protein GXO48_05565, partial [Chlorobi bacterium]|nr:hypothetical protein [Chlorobiota bacterium]